MPSTRPRSLGASLGGVAAGRLEPGWALTSAGGSLQAQKPVCAELVVQGQAHKVLRSGVASSTRGDDRNAASRVGNGAPQQASPDEVAVSHAVGRGLFVEICHLLLIQFIHVHLHICTNRKAVRDLSQARGQGRGGSAPGGAHRTGGLCREGGSQLISEAPGQHRARPGAGTTNGGDGVGVGWAGDVLGEGPNKCAVAWTSKMSRTYGGGEGRGRRDGADRGRPEPGAWVTGA